MPRYDYSCECGVKVLDVWYTSYKDAKDSVECPECGGKAEMHFGNLGTGGQQTSGWPFACEAMAVHPNAIEKSRAELVRLGVPTDFDHFGRPIMRTKQHRKQFHQATGVFDKDGSYGDHTEKSWHKDAPDGRADRSERDKLIDISEVVLRDPGDPD